MATPRFSLIVATVGRTEPLPRLLDSLAAQSFRDFEVVVVDQNRAIDLSPLLAPGNRPFRLRHLRATCLRGVSAARNAGWRAASGEVLVFPDDDCWYPADYLAKADAILRETGAELLTGRPTDESGRTINGRFEPRGGPITRATAFTTQIEWNMAVDARLMQALGGYDEGISLGGPTPWQGGEGYDLVLRALAHGAACRYAPGLVAHHDELPVARPDAAMVAKGRAYGRGLGRVLRKHGFGPLSLGWWAGRSLANLGLALARGRRDGAAYFAAQLTGRIEGWAGRTFGEP